MRLVLTLATALLLAAPAAAQAPALQGSWNGSVTVTSRSGAKVKVAVAYTFDGASAGTSRYSARGRTCRGRLTLRARERGGYVFRDRRVSGSRRNCTSGDSVFVRPSRAGLSVRVRETTGHITRFTVRKTG